MRSVNRVPGGVVPHACTVFLALSLALAPTLLAASSAAAKTKTASSRVGTSRANCTRKAARAAILGSSFGRSIEKKLPDNVKNGAGGILGHGIWKLRCADVTRDGRKEMIVVLTCCTANTPTPWAIFGRKAGKWRPAFQVVSRKTSLAGLRVNSKGDVVEKLPIYRLDDALCCPSSFSYRFTHWNGSRFVVRQPG